MPVTSSRSTMLAAYIAGSTKAYGVEPTSPVGFYINRETGVWVGKPKDDSSVEERPDQLKQLIVPLVEDRKNALLIRLMTSGF